MQTARADERKMDAARKSSRKFRCFIRLNDEEPLFVALGVADVVPVAIIVEEEEELVAVLLVSLTYEAVPFGKTVNWIGCPKMVRF